MSQKYLSICLLGYSEQIDLADIANQIAQTSTTLVETRLTRMGNGLVWQLMAEGEWSNLAKLEIVLGNLSPEIAVNWKRVEQPASPESRIPYRIWLSAADQPGILHQLLQFLANAQARIEDMSGSVYPATYTNLPAAKLEVHISLPADKPIALLRDEFSSFCESCNLDGVIESFS